MRLDKNKFRKAAEDVISKIADHYQDQGIDVFAQAIPGRPAAWEAMRRQGREDSSAVARARQSAGMALNFRRSPIVPNISRPKQAIKILFFQNGKPTSPKDWPTFHSTLMSEKGIATNSRFPEIFYIK